MGESQLPRGLERCVSTMRKGETCELICRSEYAYGEAGLPEKDVPPGASVRYEIELIGWVAPKKERFELSLDERYEAACTLKQQGGAYYSSGQYLEAQVRAAPSHTYTWQLARLLRAPSASLALEHACAI